MSTAQPTLDTTDGKPRRNDGHGSLSAKCGENGDRYYRAMTDWATKGHARDEELARRCVELGAAYLAALNELIELPGGRRSGDGVALSRLRAIEYRELLLEDLRMIERTLDGAARDGNGTGPAFLPIP